ncbi:MAG: hypothetical protein JO159_11660 [Acidobacteria bacterium]|nr:hypothetical protein [Acidobacteriota bacterium]
MKRSYLVAVFLLPALTAVGQQPPGASDRLFSSDLVAWSFMQQPRQPEPRTQPTPEPTPETQSPQNPPPGRLSPPSENPRSTPDRGRAAAETFVGTIAKEADSFVLKVSDTTSYKLDNSRQVQEFEGQRVRVVGSLDREINLIHVDKVEPLS